jgi:predicted glycosyltransferase
VLAVVRTPPDVSLYHRHENPLFADLLRRLGTDSGVQAIVLPRTAEQRSEIAALALPSLLVSEHAIDAQSLVALSDLVVSAGGTMNREAAALGVPVFTTFAGRMGAVDEELVQQGRLEIMNSPGAVRVEKKQHEGRRVERDPAVLLDLLLSALEIWRKPVRKGLGSARQARRERE